MKCKCSFCGTPSRKGGDRVFLKGKRASICAECIKLAIDVLFGLAVKGLPEGDKK